MNLAWHIARKDLFRLRIILLLWAGVLTGRMAFAMIQSRLDTASAIASIVPTWIFGFLFLPLLGVGMVMGALADDAVCDSDAFWVTRPIAGRQLLGAKLIVLGLLSLVPAVLTIPWWLAQGYDFGLLVSAFAHTTKWQLILMILATPVAALSGSNGRFVTNAVLAGVAFVVLVLIHNRFATDKTSADQIASYATCLRWVFGLWIAATIAILLNQFLSRNTRRAIAITLAAVLLAFGIAAFTGSHPGGGGQPPTVREPQSAQILGSVPLVMGAGTYHNGHGFRVTEIIPNDPRGMIVTVSESGPDFTDPKWTGTTSTSVDLKNYLFNHTGKSGDVLFKHVAYFLVHRQDHRFLPGTARPVGEELTAATLSYFRHDLIFSAPSEWKLDPAFDFQRWVADADLVKVGADEDLQEFPRALASTASTARP